MKPTILLAFLLMVLSHSSSAQSYHPFPSTNTVWGEAYKAHSDSNFRIVYYGLKSGDTVINANTYHKLYRSADTVFQEAEFYGGLRDDTAARKVYFIRGAPGNAANEILLYDFSLNQGDTLRANANNGKNSWSINGNSLVISNVDSVLIDGSYRKRMFLSFPVASVWVEGVGNIVRGLFFFPGTFPNNGTWNELVCMQQHNDWFYHLNTSWISPAHTYPSCVELLLTNMPSQGVERIPAQDGGVRFYPNPVNGISRLVLKEAGRYETVSTYDPTGRRIRLEQLGQKTEVLFNSEDFIPGLYVYRLQAKDGTYVSGRFTVE